jgi:hypothetical protein
VMTMDPYVRQALERDLWDRQALPPGIKMDMVGWWWSAEEHRCSPNGSTQEAPAGSTSCSCIIPTVLRKSPTSRCPKAAGGGRSFTSATPKRRVPAIPTDISGR